MPSIRSAAVIGSDVNCMGKNVKYIGSGAVVCTSTVISFAVEITFAISDTLLMQFHFFCMGSDMYTIISSAVLGTVMSPLWEIKYTNPHLLM